MFKNQARDEPQMKARRVEDSHSAAGLCLLCCLLLSALSACVVVVLKSRAEALTFCITPLSLSLRAFVRQKRFINDTIRSDFHKRFLSAGSPTPLHLLSRLRLSSTYASPATAAVNCDAEVDQVSQSDCKIRLQLGRRSDISAFWRTLADRYIK